MSICAFAAGQYFIRRAVSDLSVLDPHETPIIDAHGPKSGSIASLDSQSIGVEELTHLVSDPRRDRPARLLNGAAAENPEDDDYCTNLLHCRNIRSAPRLIFHPHQIGLLRQFGQPAARPSWCKLHAFNKFRFA